MWGLRYSEYCICDLNDMIQYCNNVIAVVSILEKE